MLQQNYGFVIDNRKCIGCHACSTACKSENEVSLGVYRTWVKYVETGTYPDARRHFQVTRCNHCANPPCARICPTQAMYQRADGIVEFDNSVCIGCKACMQACPYDAIYIDPETDTAAKCHFCAHRTDIGLEPACVVICPEHAIIAGDMNNPMSEISQVLAKNDVTVRKPEQGTAPKLFYIEGNDISMHPTATERAPDSFMWADVIPLHQGGSHSNGHSPVVQQPIQHSNGTAIRKPQTQGQPSAGPIQFGKGRVADHMVQVGYNAQHKVPWHWPVPAYLVTKGIGSGIFMLFALGLGLEWFQFDGTTAVISGFLSLLFIAITTGFLVFDLEKPERFLYIIARPQWKSWLTRGAFLLIGFSIIGGLWFLTEWGAELGWIDNWTAQDMRPYFLWVGFPLSVGVAVYTAFLFAQAEGRDLWQSPLLPFHLVVQAFMVGSGALLLLSSARLFRDDFVKTAFWAFVTAVIIDLFLIFVGEFAIPHASEVAAKAAHDIRNGRYKNHFWYGSILVGHIIPLLLCIFTYNTSGNFIVAAIAGLAAIIGLYYFEYAFVMAPQDIPNS